MIDDEIRTTLATRRRGAWGQVGTADTVKLREGAPFTVGSALGLGHDNALHAGSQLFIAGVAVLNHVLKEDELKQLRFDTGLTNDVR